MEELALLFNSQAETLADNWRVASVNRDTQVGQLTCPSRSTDPHDSVNRHRRPGQPAARPRSTVCMIPVNRVRSDVTYSVDSLSEFIAETASEGRRLDFGGFSVGLKIRKGFRSANAPFESYDRIAADGVRLLSATGCYPQIHENAPDEGLWIEDDEGVRPISCEIVRRDFGNTDYKLTGPLKRGSYWLVIQSRYKDEPALIRVRRRIRVA